MTRSQSYRCLTACYCIISTDQWLLLDALRNFYICLTFPCRWPTQLHGFCWHPSSADTRGLTLVYYPTHINQYVLWLIETALECCFAHCWASCPSAVTGCLWDFDNHITPQRVMRQSKCRKKTSIVTCSHMITSWCQVRLVRQNVLHM